MIASLLNAYPTMMASASGVAPNASSSKTSCVLKRMRSRLPITEPHSARTDWGIPPTGRVNPPGDIELRSLPL
jgi:hypothetical protein